MKLAQRLLLGSLLVVSALVLLVVALSGLRLRSQLFELTATQLSREARLLSLEWRFGADADSIADAAGAALGHRITFVDPSGRVVGDSEFDGPALARLENHRTRPEIVAARAGGAGSARRVSASAGDEELYVAVPSPLGFARVSVPTRQLNAIVGRALRDVLISGLIALVAASLLAFAFSRAISRPIVELRDVTKALAAGDLSRRPALSAPGEVGDLAASVHSMAEQLDSRLKALAADDAFTEAMIESLNEGVVAVDGQREVFRLNESGRRLLALRARVPFSAELLPRERTLRDALETALGGRSVEHAELTWDGRTLALTTRPLVGGGAVLALYDLTAVRRLETVRRDFVANVSHELRTPLTVIGGFAETLATDEMEPAQRQQFADTIRANAHRMQRIVDDLLDLSRIESGGWVPNPTDADVRSIANDALAVWRGTAAQKGVEVALSIDADAETIYADPTALRQVLTNLIENAVRYTLRGGSVTVFSARDERGVWTGVRDTGIGIAPSHLSRIFERFYRADPARSREAGGTGLGLAIVRHLAEAHGGRVTAESVVGSGTTVKAFFPTPAFPSS
ncbi:MAG: ATP-binding protein [Gemmatimonadaceae bacterium]